MRSEQGGYTWVAIHPVLSGDDGLFLSDVVHRSLRICSSRGSQTRRRHLPLPKDPADITAKSTIAVTEYTISIHILEENSLKNAKRLGYLDVRELYPGLPKHTLEEVGFTRWKNLVARMIRVVSICQQYSRFQANVGVLAYLQFCPLIGKSGI
ncbi:hypothetical protein GY45DRAFT_1124766 [Cubamyces sp. BRFM 1775]|nr:hypothetical protein GY45DRAFT_1124766 [Cubamyces sp. BRFM 1775]